MFPHARQDTLLIREMRDEIVVYDLERHQAHSLTRTAALIWRMCDGQTSVPELARRVEEELNTPIDERVVWLVLQRLEQANLLREAVSRPKEIAGMPRRQAISLGLAGAAALLLHGCGVDSVAAASPAQAHPLCCRYTGPAVLVQDCPTHYTCPGPPVLPVRTDFRCDHRDCPPSINVRRHCLNHKGEPDRGSIRCTYEVGGPICVPC
jgi:hypothetical protein